VQVAQKGADARTQNKIAQKRTAPNCIIFQLLIIFALPDYLEMKRISSFIVLIATTFGLSCTDKPIDNLVVEEPSTPVIPIKLDTLTISDKLIELDCNYNEYTFAVNVNCDYDIIIPVDWVSRVKTKAMRTDSITLCICENKTYYPRECDIIIQSLDSIMSDTLRLRQEEGFNSLAKALKRDESISLFYKALVLTGMIDSIREYVDESFVSRELEQNRFYFGYSWYSVTYHDYMCIRYTIFCETDSILSSKYDINTIDDLFVYSKKVYDESFPEDANQYDKDFTDRRNPLNRFISYHILPMGVSYDKLNPSHEEIKRRFIKWNEIDFEDYYSPLLQHSLLKISTPYQSEIRFINRKGTEVEGISIDPNGIEASNGYAYYLSDIITYGKFEREKVLNTRLRILPTTMFPEIMNNGARDSSYYDDGNRMVVSLNDHFKKSYCVSDDTQFFLSYLKRGYNSFMGDELFLGSQFDISFKLPSVPTDGLYEIRFRGSHGNDRPDVVQFYLNGVECGSPISFFNPREKCLDIWVQDDVFSGLENEDSLINANDDSLRVHGYMKDVASYTTYDYRPYRDKDHMLRRIICSDVYLEANNDYYLRIKKLDQGEDAEKRSMRLDVIEIVPKYIYDGPIREDKN
jgi:hypothetical protein